MFGEPVITVKPELVLELSGMLNTTEPHVSLWLTSRPFFVQGPADIYCYCNLSEQMACTEPRGDNAAPCAMEPEQRMIPTKPND